MPSAKHKGQSGKVRRQALAWLREHADPDNVAPMDAYMKLEERGDPLGHLGVKSEGRKELVKILKAEFPPESPEQYRQHIAALWDSPIREMRHTAINYARALAKKNLDLDALSMLEQMVRDSRWWDLVDGIAAWLVSLCIFNIAPR